MKTQKEINKEKGCRYTFGFLCILVIIIVVLLFLYSCRPSICPAYTSTGQVYYPYPKSYVHSQRMNGLHEDIWTPSRTNSHSLIHKRVR